VKRTLIAKVFDRSGARSVPGALETFRCEVEPQPSARPRKPLCQARCEPTAMVGKQKSLASDRSGPKRLRRA
jgi:hypothetical protein